MYQLPGGGSAGGGYVGGPLPGLPSAQNYLNQALGWMQTPVTSYPDYNAILAKLLAPIQGLTDAQTAALQASVNQQGALATENAKLAQEGLSQAHTQALKSISDTLTARGLADSGDVHYRNTQENTSYNRATELGQNSLLAYLRQLQDTLVQQKLQALFQMQQAQQALLPQIQQQYQPTTSYPNNFSGSSKPLVGM